MYPNLSYLLHDLFGTPRDNAFAIVQMFGLLMGIAFFALGYILYLELKRKEQEGIIESNTTTEWIGKGADIKEVISNALFGFVLTFKLPVIMNNFEAFKEDAAGIVFSGMGNWVTGILGLSAFGMYTFWKGQKTKLPQPKQVTKNVHPHERVSEIIILAAIFGILGARLFSILENMDAFWQDPLGQIFSGSGLTIYGGFILASIVIYYYVKKNGIPPIHVMDAIAPALIIGYGIGRMGCHVSGDGDWGIVNEMAKPAWFFFPDWMWAYDYPNNVLNEGVPIAGCMDRHCSRLSPPVFPTPIYEIISSLSIFGILWYLRTRIKTPGQIAMIFLVLMGVARFAVESIRVNPRYPFLGMELSQAQLISAGLVIAGLIGYFIIRQRSNSAISSAA